MNKFLDDVWFNHSQHLLDKINGNLVRDEKFTNAPEDFVSEVPYRATITFTYEKSITTTVYPNPGYVVQIMITCDEVMSIKADPLKSIEIMNPCVDRAIKAIEEIHTKKGRNYPLFYSASIGKDLPVFSYSCAVNSYVMRIFAFPGTPNE